MQRNTIVIALLCGSMMLACVLTLGPARAQDNIPNFAGSWMEVNVAPENAMTLKITQKGNEINEEVFGRLTIVKGIASSKQVQQCAPPFRKLGYDYDANPSYYTIILALKGKNLVFNRANHWVTPCDGHAISTEHETHLLQRYP